MAQAPQTERERIREALRQAIARSGATPPPIEQPSAAEPEQPGWWPSILRLGYGVGSYMGGPKGAVISGAGELASQWAGDEPVNIPRILAEAAWGLVPASAFLRAGKIPASMLRAGGITAAQDITRQLTPPGQNLEDMLRGDVPVPDISWTRFGTMGALGAATGGILGRFTKLPGEAAEAAAKGTGAEAAMWRTPPTGTGTAATEAVISVRGVPPTVTGTAFPLRPVTGQAAEGIVDELTHLRGIVTRVKTGLQWGDTAEEIVSNRKAVFAHAAQNPQGEIATAVFGRKGMPPNTVFKEAETHFKAISRAAEKAAKEAVKRTEAQEAKTAIQKAIAAAGLVEKAPRVVATTTAKEGPVTTRLQRIFGKEAEEGDELLEVLTKGATTLSGDTATALRAIGATAADIAAIEARAIEIGGSADDIARSVLRQVTPTTGPVAPIVEPAAAAPSTYRTWAEARGAAKRLGGDAVRQPDGTWAVRMPVQAAAAPVPTAPTATVAPVTAAETPGVARATTTPTAPTAAAQATAAPIAQPIARLISDPVRRVLVDAGAGADDIVKLEAAAATQGADPEALASDVLGWATRTGKTVGPLTDQQINIALQHARRAEKLGRPLHFPVEAPTSAAAAGPAGGAYFTSDEFARMTPAQRRDAVDRVAKWYTRTRKGMSDAKGAIITDASMQIALGGLGAAAGAAIDPFDDRVASAIVGGAVMAGIPRLMSSAIRRANEIGDVALALQKAPITTREALKNATTTKGMLALADNVINELPSYVRAMLLTSHNLGSNAIAAPYGAGMLTGLQYTMIGDPRGRKLLHLMATEWHKEFPKSWVEATDLIRRFDPALAKERGFGFVTEAAGQKVGKIGELLRAPGSFITMGDMTTRKLAIRAGFSEAEARVMTLTNEPFLLDFIVNFQRRGGLLGRLALPFARTHANIFEQGLYRTPLVGSFARQAARLKAGHAGKLLAQPSKAEQLGEQMVGGLVLGTGVGAGLVAPEDRVFNNLFRGFVQNVAGPWSALATLGYGIGTGIKGDASLPGAVAGGVGQIAFDAPMPSFDIPRRWGQTGYGVLSGEAPPSELLTMPGVVPSIVSTIVREASRQPKTAEEAFDQERERIREALRRATGRP